MDIKRGMRGKLFEHFDKDKPIEVVMKTRGAAEYDQCCFGVDENDLLSDERYMIFYNQTRSPSDEIVFASGENASFSVQPVKLPDTVKKLVFTVSIDGEGTMGDISGFEVSIGQSGSEPLLLSLTGSDFSAEKAIIAIEIYFKNEWRYSAVAQGFNGGLSDLLEAYGGEEAVEESTEPAETKAALPQPGSVPESSDPVPSDAAAPEVPAKAPPETIRDTADETNVISLKKLGDKRIELKKNERIELRKKDNKPFNEFTVGLGWDPAKAGASIDCDSSVFLCKNGRLSSEDDIVSFYNTRHRSGAVIHGGDNLTGEGAGDDEKIRINLDRMPGGYDRIVIVVNIFLSRITRQHFGKIKNCYMRLCDPKGGEVCRYTLSGSREYDRMSAMIFGEFTKEDGSWVFHAIGEGTKDHSIGALAKRFR